MLTIIDKTDRLMFAERLRIQELMREHGLYEVRDYLAKIGLDNCAVSYVRDVLTVYQPKCESILAREALDVAESLGCDSGMGDQLTKLRDLAGGE